MIDLRDVARRVALAFGAGFVVVVPAAARMLRRWHSAVDVREPSEEVRDNLPGTFERHLPGLRGKIAHYQLGEFPTPIGTLSFEDPKTEKTFVVSLKREDMSSTLYGGNKVRTLEFQLACAAEAIKDVHGGGAISPVGGPGSNQVVATQIYAAHFGLPCSNLVVAPEGPALDNALNIMSMISLPGWTGATWAEGFTRVLQQCSDALLHGLPLPPGGNNRVGALGHVGAILELCEQLGNGTLKRLPRHIFLPLGSSCTTAGLLCGIALARKLQLGFTDEVMVHGVVIHHALAKVPAIGRWLIRTVAHSALDLVQELAGIDAHEELEVLLNTSLTIHSSYAGSYGSWTAAGLLAKEVVSAAHLSEPQPKPWMCSTFSSKCFAAMLDFIRAAGNLEEGDVLLWCTKSLIQPRGQISATTAWERVLKMPGGAQRYMRRSGVPHEAEFTELWSRRLQSKL